jgi:hypothetical protein
MTYVARYRVWTIDDGVHLDLAEDILKALFNDDMESASRVVWCVVMLLTMAMVT